MASGLKDFSSVLSSKIIVLILAVGTQSVLAWFLGPEGRGSYAVCIIFASIMSVLFNFGCDSASVYFVSSSRFTISEGINSVLVYGAFISVLATALGFILMHSGVSFFEKASVTDFHLALVCIPASLFAQVLPRLLTAVQHFGWFAFATIFTRVTQLVLAFIFVGILAWGVSGALLAVIFSGLLTSLFVLLLFFFKYKIRFDPPSLSNLFQMFRYGLRDYLGKLGSLVNVKIGTVVLGFFAAPAEIGIFAVASDITTRTMVIPNSLQMTLFPKVSAAPESRKKLVAQCARITAVISFLILSFIAIFATPLVSIVFSPEFLPAVPLIRILAVGVIIRSAAKTFVSYLLGTNHPGIISISILAGLVLNISILYCFLPRIGIVAAPIAVCAYYIVSSLILLWGYLRYSSMSLGETLKFNRSDWGLIWSPVNKLKARIIG